MKIIVISDTHGERSWILEAVSRHPDATVILHCGDYASDMDILTESELEKHFVRGNVPDLKFAGRSHSEEIMEQVLIFDEIRVLLTHGHVYDVKHTLNRLYYRALEAEVDLVLFGHTHLAMNETIGDVAFFNPGSPARPRGGPPSYGVIEVRGKIFRGVIHKFIE